MYVQEVADEALSFHSCVRRQSQGNPPELQPGGTCASLVVIDLVTSLQCSLTSLLSS